MITHSAHSLRLYLCLLTALLLAAWAATCSDASAAAAQRVLVVHSYHEDQKEHVVEMTRGIEEALAGADCVIRYFHMDTKRHNTEQWKRTAGEQARLLADEYRPQVIITMDDNAQMYFAKDYAKASGPPYFVFGGVNADPQLYGFPTDKVTGVLERPNITESIELLLKIKPAIKTLLIVADKSETTDPFVAYCKTLKLPVTVKAYAQPLTFDALQAVLAQYHDQVDAIGLYIVRAVARSTTDPTKVPEQEIVAHINERYKIPTVGFFDTAAEAGTLCGVSVSMREQGFAAGLIARGILDGKKPTDFTVKPTDRGRIQLNLRTAERLGVQLPYSMIQRADVVIR
ncbi:MAG: hypothetical protein JZU50_09150 [Desulfobulbaceae bacterium]|nr:hypothetical protein [Desulfobulbaceae bacterium]